MSLNVEWGAGVRPGSLEQFLDGRTRDGMGRILSHAVPFFPIQSHISHSKVAISPDSKLTGRSPDVPERKLLVTCPVLSRFVPPGPRGSAERAKAVCGKCQDGGAFGHWCHTTWCHTTMVRRRHEAWQAANVISYTNANATGEDSGRLQSLFRAARGESAPLSAA